MVIKLASSFVCVLLDHLVHLTLYCKKSPAVSPQNNAFVMLVLALNVLNWVGFFIWLTLSWCVG